MIINGNEIKEIIVTNNDDELIVTITDKNIIYFDGFKIVLRGKIST